MKTKSCVLPIFLMCSYVLFVSSEDAPSNTEQVKQIVESYLKTLAKDSKVDFTVILSRQKLYADGTLKQVDTVAFASKAENTTIPNDFNLGTIGKKIIKKIVNDGEDKGILVSFEQEKIVEDSKNTTTFDTEELELDYSGATSVVLHDNSFTEGLEDQINEVMDMTDNVAVIKVLEYFKSGNIKRNITTTVQTSKVAVLDSYKMTPRRVQESADTLKKAYKIDVENRSPIIAELFKQKFPKYDWQVLQNAEEYLLKKDTMVHLSVGDDSYHIIGVNN